MNQEAALEYVRLQADTSCDPVVTDDEVLGLLSQFRLADRDGNAPGSEGWSESYWLPRVVAEVLALKVLRAASWVDASTDGTSFSASQAVEALRRQESRWRRRCSSGA